MPTQRDQIELTEQGLTELVLYTRLPLVERLASEALHILTAYHSTLPILH